MCWVQFCKLFQIEGYTALCNYMYFHPPALLLLSLSEVFVLHVCFEKLLVNQKLVFARRVLGGKKKIPITETSFITIIISHYYIWIFDLFYRLKNQLTGGSQR